MFFGGLEFLFPAILIGLIVLAIVAITAGRREADPEARRPFAIYLTSVLFVAMFTALIAGVSVVSSLSELVFVEQDTSASDENCFPTPGGGMQCVSDSGASFGPEEGSFNFINAFEEDHSDIQIRNAVRSGLIVLAAVAVLWWHWRMAASFWPASGSPPDRTFVAYAYVVCFVAMLVALGAAVAAAYGLFQIAAPGITATGPDASIRDQGLVSFLTSAALLAGSGWMFKLHWQRRPMQAAEDDLQQPSTS